MKARARQFLTGCLALIVSLFVSNPAAFAQDSQLLETMQNAPSFTRHELDQMLASIALYPDPGWKRPQAEPARAAAANRHPGA